MLVQRSATRAAAATATAVVTEVAEVAIAIAVTIAVAITIATTTATGTTTTAAAAAIAVSRTTTVTAAEAARRTGVTRATATTRAGLVLRLVHSDCPPVELLAIELFDRLIGCGCVRVGHEPEAARATRLTVRDDLRLGDLAEAPEGLLQAIVGGAPRQPADKQFLRHLSL